MISYTFPRFPLLILRNEIANADKESQLLDEGSRLQAFQTFHPTLYTFHLNFPLKTFLTSCIHS